MPIDLNMFCPFVEHMILRNVKSRLIAIKDSRFFIREKPNSS